MLYLRVLKTQAGSTQVETMLGSSLKKAQITTLRHNCSLNTMMDTEQRKRRDKEPHESKFNYYLRFSSSPSFPYFLSLSLSRKKKIRALLLKVGRCARSSRP